MKRFFDMENPVMKALSIVADLILLNLLTILCSLPVLTMGAAVTAMYATAIKLIRGEDGALLKDYFNAFKGSLKRGSVFGILLIIAAALLYFDYLAAKTMIPVLCPVIAAMAVMVLTLAQYTFALLARYENTLLATLKNGVALAIGYFPRTLGMVVFALGFWLLLFQFFRYGAPILILFGLSLPCYVCVLLMNGMFTKLENK